MAHFLFFRPSVGGLQRFVVAALVLGVTASAHAQVGLQLIGLEGFTDEDTKIAGAIIRAADQDTEIATAPFSFVKPAARAVVADKPETGLYVNSKLILQTLFPAQESEFYARGIRVTTYLYFHDTPNKTTKEYSSVKSSGEKTKPLPFRPDALTRWDGKRDWTVAPKTKDKNKIAAWKADLEFFQELRWRCEQYKAQSAALQGAFPKITIAYVPYLEDWNQSGKSNLGQKEVSKLWKFCGSYAGAEPIRRSPNYPTTRKNSKLALELHGRKVFSSGTKMDKFGNTYALGGGDAWSLDGDTSIPIGEFATYEKYRAIAIKNKVTALYWNARFNADENDDYNSTPGFNRGQLHPYSSYVSKTKKFSLSKETIAASYYGLKGYNKDDKGYEVIVQAFNAKSAAQSKTILKDFPEPPLTPAPVPVPNVAPTPDPTPNPTSGPSGKVLSLRF